MTGGRWGQGPDLGLPLRARGCVPSVPPDSLEEVQVHDTNYTTFALMFSRRQSGSPPVIRVHLLCEPFALLVVGSWGQREQGGWVVLLGLGPHRAGTPTTHSPFPVAKGNAVFLGPRQNVGD